MFRKLVFLVFFSYTQCLVDNLLSLEKKYSELEARVKQLEADNAKCPCVDAVAFNVQLMHDMNPLAAYQHIIFDHIILNIGDCYDKYSGHFVAPYHGLYSFVVSFTKNPEHNLSIMIVKNRAAITQGISNTKDAFDTATVSAAVELMKGDHVWVENAYPAGNIESLDGIWTFFSGHLVMAMPRPT